MESFVLRPSIIIYENTADRVRQMFVFCSFNIFIEIDLIIGDY